MYVCDHGSRWRDPDVGVGSLGLSTGTGAASPEGDASHPHLSGCAGAHIRHRACDCGPARLQSGMTCME
eukprot:5019068-Pyramimonas_sp.AAC.1